MGHVCANCDQLILDNFCGNCGQKKYKRIDRKYVLDEVQYMLLHTNKGFLYSLKNIVINPGKTAKEFIDGNRINHYKPLLMTFVLSGLSAFISYKIIGVGDVMREYYAGQHLNSALMNDMMSALASYSAIILLLLVPCFALFTRLAFRKWGHNYYEHVIMNSYFLSFFTVVYMVLIYPLLYFFKGDVGVFAGTTSVSFLMVPFILVWFFKGVYVERTWKAVIGKVLLTMLLTLLGYLAFLMIIFIATVVFVAIKGPEAQKYLQPK